MMNPEDRYNNWQELTERVKELFVDVEDVRDTIYARYNQEPDKDTPFIDELFTRLDSLNDFMKSHLSELESAYDIYEEEQYNLMSNFEAWRTGLCPKLMRKVSCFSYDDVAKFKTQKAVSYQDTQQAILRWNEQEKQRFSA